MITTYLQGGLGNILFQISTAYSLALDNNDECIFDLDNGNFTQRNPNDYKSNILKNVKNGDIRDGWNVKHTYTENGFEYNKIKYQKDMKLEGYFQSEKYFNHNRKKILNLFGLNEFGINSGMNPIFSSNTVSLHVRRGDYLSQTHMFSTCGLDYYKEAISKFPFANHIIVFSDDIEWCKENFTEGRFLFVEDSEDYHDLYLMSICKNNIIANSSFSWWGAWLNQNENKKVIAPSKWFGNSNSHLDTKDLIPESWEII
jgi:hypothetical protein